ncbi:Na(+)-translocating NADH-quinone reductase subunit F [Oxobacter pfennigii]|uniref:Na(+)-translocating NADH-quinone reductase subunit F n=1 Tax=Oxobacter pfennigii TaxID=36849 RepID=A0A0P8W9V1_9CLOT|nr:ASKHA domain-containing protein [Oxobacter pfennigii]KPU45396.1 Na(+)-translocating NADH-quinone reductase subunit F [Oxobacter pfennigii]
MRTFQITVKKDGGPRVIYANEGDNLLKVMIKEGIYVQTPCGGKGICGKCKVIFHKGAKEPANTDIKHLSEDEISRGMRLACGVIVDEPMDIEVPTVASAINVLTTGSEDMDIQVSPFVIKKYLNLTPPSIHDQRSDIRRIQDGLGITSLSARSKLMREMHDVLIKSDYKVTVSVYKGELLNIEAGDASDKSYGIAVDIGTTTVASYLIDLTSGKVIDVESGVNAQRPYGADVISRINYTIQQKDGLTTLRDAIVNQLGGMLIKLCERNNMETKHVYNVTVVGNTTMTHLFLGVPCESIAVSPYIPVVTDLVEVPGREMNMPIDGYVSVLPGVASYVGSDITAGILACGMHKSEKYSLLLDLGTNGEMAVGNKDGIVSCATAAGPAFEGATIKWGIGGVKGAVSKIDLSQDKIYSTIGDAKPIGICGSGVLDAVSEFVKYEIINKTGRMYKPEELDLPDSLKNRITTTDSGKQFTIEGDVVFTQKDVREVQLAKAAVSAGMKILVKEAGIEFKDVETIYVAGGFGNFMNIESALNIGLLPKELAGKVKSIGNSAGTGSKMCLLSESAIGELEKISNSTKYVELSGRPDFEGLFVDSMVF